MIIPYFGKFPEWMDLYLYTVGRNTGIDFHYFTDCELNTPPLEFTSNIFFHRTTFQEYRNLVFEKTGIHLPNNPMKLCDLKPFYGIIHKEMLLSNDYEWWGFGDIDLVYGNLSPIVRLSQTNKYDVITTHIKCIAGHFTLIRTKSAITKIALEIPNIKRLVEDKESLWVDEYYFSEYIRPRNLRIIDKLWYRIGEKMGFDRNKFYFALKNIFPHKHYMWDPCTTFTPIKNEKYVLNLQTLQWTIGKGLFPKGIKPSNDMPYLHFLLFKEKSYNKSGYHWGNNFWGIPNDYKWQGTEVVEISSDGIRILD